MTIPPGSTVTPIPDGRRVIWPTDAVRHKVKFVVTPYPRDARLAELTTALQHIRTLASDAPSLSVEPCAILAAIALIAVDALAGEALAGEAQPSATAYEELAI